jgi:hypothetical protein
VEEGFAEIRQMTLDPETAAIAGEGLPAKSAYLRTISFQDIQNLQSILSDKTKVCTDEFQSAIEGVNSSAIMRNLLWLLRIPSDEASRIALCGTDHVKSYSKTLADDRVAAEPASKPEAENPAAMPEDAAKPAAENPAAMPEDAAKPAAENPAAMPEASAPESAGTMPATAPTEMPEAATTKKTGGKRRRLLRKRY